MKRHRFDPIEVLKSHQTALQERVKGAADPRQKQLLERRLQNLDGVIQFLTTTHSAIDGTGPEAKLSDAPGSAKRMPTKSGVGKERSEQQWRLPMGTGYGNV